MLTELQRRYDAKEEICFTAELFMDYVTLIVDEKYFAKEFSHINGRRASIDMNPNYIALIIRNEKGEFLQQEIFDFKQLSELDKRKLTEQKNELSQQTRELDELAKQIHSRLETNKTVLQNILSTSSELAMLEKQYSWVKTLSDTANGTISGKEKITLEAYIQMTYFERIIARANTRFMMMTGGQYELVRRTKSENKQAQSGLDLDVIDHYIGAARSVKTLSGGESFKASLSLALGLSDEIQSCAGGVKLETMFVDEGFGSLDSDSLEQAMNALNSLADSDRLIGIISHVDALKSRIDNQIVISKDPSGISSAQICLA